VKYINVFKTHFDIGFTDLARNVVKSYAKMLERVLFVCEESNSRGAGKRFVWTLSAWPMLASLDALANSIEYSLAEKSALIARVEKLIADGQIVIHALPYTFHTEFLSELDLAHVFDSADEFCSRFKKQFPISAKMTDVPGHTCAIIKPLVEKGVKFLHLGCNPAATTPDVPILFWWEDMTGNRILTFYSKIYGSQLLQPKDWEFPVWLALNQTGDNAGPQTVEVLEEIERAQMGNDSSAEVIFGSLDDFYLELCKCDLSRLPVIRGELGDTWIHGVGSYPKEVSMLRRARRKLDVITLTPEEEKKFFENSLLFTEHTWGANVMVHMRDRRYEKTEFLNQRRSGKYLLPEESWQEQRDRANVCAELVEKYVPLYEPFSSGCAENGRWRIECRDGLKLVHKQSGTTLEPTYCYETVGEKKIEEYLNAYLRLHYDWSISDNGRDDYHEPTDRLFESIFVSSKTENGVTRVTYETKKESYETYGNAEQVTLYATAQEEKVFLRVVLKNKHASPIVEGGNLVIKTNLRGEKYRVKKINQVIDPEKDVVKGANFKLFCVSDLVSIDRLEIDPIDSPLVSFGESAIYRYQAGGFEKPQKPSFVFNLFNNMWGTNFPQWTEADELIFDYVITFKE